METTTSMLIADVTMFTKYCF